MNGRSKGWIRFGDESARTEVFGIESEGNDGMSRPLTPIERMIDAATGNVPAAEKSKRLSTNAEREAAKKCADDVAGYLSAMFPDHWRGLSQSFKRSLRGSIHNGVVEAFKRVHP